MLTSTCLQLLLLSTAAGAATPELVLATFISDSMVLQRTPQAAVVWGNATAGADVSVTLDRLPAVVVRAGKKGAWVAALRPQPAGADRTLTVVSGTTTLIVKDVAFGDVFICTGQSNVSPLCYSNIGSCRLPSPIPNGLLHLIGLGVAVSLCARVLWNVSVFVLSCATFTPSSHARKIPAHPPQCAHKKMPTMCPQCAHNVPD